MTSEQSDLEPLIEREGSLTQAQSKSRATFAQTKEYKEMMKEPATFMWGTERDEEIMEICTIYETNICRDSGYAWLIFIRIISFTIMASLLYADY